MTQNKWSLQMKIVIGIISTAAVFAVIAGVIYGISAANREDVMVIPVSDADYGSEDDYSNTMDGRISTGSSQSVLYDPDKPIVEIKVKKGDRVQKGAALVVYDSTQTSDELEQKELDVRSVEVSMKRAQRTLDTLNAAQQVIVPEEEEEEDEEDEADPDEEIIGGAIAPEKKGKADAGDAAADASDDSAEADDDEDADSEEEEGPDLSDFDPGETVYVASTGEVYSVADWRKAKIEAENEIRSLTTDLTEANANLEATQKALSDDTVTATIDGVVTRVKNPAKGGMEAGETVVLVSTFEGIFVNTAINEWLLGTVEVGSKLYVTNWHNGKVYTAKVTEISPYASPELSQQFSDSDRDDSYYPLTARIDKDNVKLSDGDSVEISLTKPGDYEDDEDADEPIYLYKAFVVSEGENKYVYMADEEGKLKKQKIEISGQETETYIVTDGITEEDFIAFPFGDNIREGANTVEGAIEDLYEDYY